MQPPYINQNGDLVVPNFADSKYHYWDESNPDRMTVGAILDEIGATDEVKSKYAAEVAAPVEAPVEEKPKRVRGAG